MADVSFIILPLATAARATAPIECLYAVSCRRNPAAVTCRPNPYFRLEGFTDRQRKFATKLPLCCPNNTFVRWRSYLGLHVYAESRMRYSQFNHICADVVLSRQVELLQRVQTPGCGLRSRQRRSASARKIQ